MSYRVIGGEDHYVARGMLVDEASGAGSPGTFALKRTSLDEYLNRGQGTKWLQLMNIALPGLIDSAHIFKGLRRDLFNDDNALADKESLVYTWKPRRDWEWDASGHSGHGRSVEMPAPIGAVFAVTACRNVRHREKYPEIDAFIGAWNWIDGEDAVLAGAPVGWVDRYDSKLWTRSDK